MSQRNRRSSILKAAALNNEDASTDGVNRPKRRVSFHTHRIVKEYEKNGECDIDHTPQRERMQLSGQSDLSSSLNNLNCLSNKENCSSVGVSVHEVGETTINQNIDNTFVFVENIDCQTEKSKFLVLPQIDDPDDTMIIFDNNTPSEIDENSISSTQDNVELSKDLDGTMAIFWSPGSEKSFNFNVECDDTMAIFDTSGKPKCAASNILDFESQSTDGNDELNLNAKADVNFGPKKNSLLKSPVSNTTGMSIPRVSKFSELSTTPISMEVFPSNVSTASMIEMNRDEVLNPETNIQTSSISTLIADKAVSMEGVELVNNKTESDNISTNSSVPLNQTYVFEGETRVPVEPTPALVIDKKLPVHEALKIGIGKHAKPRPELLLGASPNRTNGSMESSYFYSPSKTFRLEANETLNNKLRRISGALMEAKQNRRRSDVLKTAGKPDHVESPMEAVQTQFTENGTATKPLPCDQNTFLATSVTKKCDTEADMSAFTMNFSGVLNLSHINDPSNMFNDSSFAMTANDSVNAETSTCLEKIATPLPMFESTLNTTSNILETKANNSVDSEISASFNRHVSLGPSNKQMTADSIELLQPYDPDVTRTQASLSATRFRNIYEEFNLGNIDAYCHAVATNNIDFAEAKDVTESSSFVNSTFSDDMSKSCRTPMMKCHLRVSEPSFGMLSSLDSDSKKSDDNLSSACTSDNVVDRKNNVFTPNENFQETTANGSIMSAVGDHSASLFSGINHKSWEDSVAAVSNIETVESNANDVGAENEMCNVSTSFVPASGKENDDGTYTLSPNHSLLHQIGSGVPKLFTPSNPLSFTLADSMNCSVAENLSNSMAFSAMTYSFSKCGFADRHLTADESIRFAKFCDEVAGLQALIRPLAFRWPNLAALANDIVPGFVIYENFQKFNDLNYLIVSAHCDLFLETATAPNELKEQVMLVGQKFKLAYNARKKFTQLLKSTYPYSAFFQEFKTYCVDLLMSGKHLEYNEYIEYMSKVREKPSEAQRLYEQRLLECKQEGENTIAAIDAQIHDLCKTKLDLYAKFSNM